MIERVVLPKINSTIPAATVIGTPAEGVSKANVGAVLRGQPISFQVNGSKGGLIIYTFLARDVAIQVRDALTRAIDSTEHWDE
jgi:hypothetical protein